MNQSLKEFRDAYQEMLLNFLWRQWSAIGVAGYGAGDDDWAIDPEAILVFSCTLARHDPRLFDEILDWLLVNGDFINVQRLKTILKTENFAAGAVLPAIFYLMSEEGKPSKANKWRRFSKVAEDISKPGPLFYFKGGAQIEQFGPPEPHFSKFGLLRGKIKFRKHSQPVRVVKNTGFLFKLRAIFGISARSEIMLYLLTHDNAHPSVIAKDIYYSQKTVQDTLVEMSYSGLIVVRPAGKIKEYRINAEKWLQLFHEGEKPLKWVCWPKVFRALEKIWLKLGEEKFLKMEPLLQSSELRQLMREIRPKIETSGLSSHLSDDKFYLGEEFPAVFLKDVIGILKFK